MGCRSGRTMRASLRASVRASIPARSRRSQPGELVQMDCFFIGRLSESKGSVWQYTAIDVASGYTWAELHTSEPNPRSRHCQALLHRLGEGTARARRARGGGRSDAGWKLATVTSDNGSEFVSQDFATAVRAAGAHQRRVKAGRPTSNGCVERVQLTILERCWRPSFARSLVPKVTALRRDLDEYLTYHNTDRAHTGRHTQGRVPAEIVYGAPKMRAAR